MLLAAWELLSCESDMLVDRKLVLHDFMKRWKGFQLGSVLLLGSQDMPRSYWVMSCRRLGAFGRPCLGKGLGLGKGLDRNRHSPIRVIWQAEAATVFYKRTGALIPSVALNSTLSPTPRQRILSHMISLPYPFPAMQPCCVCCQQMHGTACVTWDFLLPLPWSMCCEDVISLEAWMSGCDSGVGTAFLRTLPIIHVIICVAG